MGIRETKNIEIKLLPMRANFYLGKDNLFKKYINISKLFEDSLNNTEYKYKTREP